LFWQAGRQSLLIVVACCRYVNISNTVLWFTQTKALFNTLLALVSNKALTFKARLQDNEHRRIMSTADYRIADPAKRSFIALNN
jgi:hypothetical protein